MTDFPEDIPIKKVKYTDPAGFLKLRETTPLVDVRSPSEFSRGHIPGAVNIPIFDDKEREKVGIKYAKKGRTEAIYEGLSLIGDSMSAKLKEAVKTAPDGKILVYCWRGGMRSSSMAWLFSLGDLEVTLLEGGYKAYRNHILDYLSRPEKVIVLGGYTGSGKTEILGEIAHHYQVIDLEGLASHRGSAFGRMQTPQPTTEHFANMMYEAIAGFSLEEPLFAEDESRAIGSVFIPDEFHRLMQAAPVIAIEIPSEERCEYLAGLYGESGREQLVEAVGRIEKRLGGDKAKEAVKLINEGDLKRRCGDTTPLLRQQLPLYA